MFEAFPIIRLDDQEKAINRVIVREKLSKEDILYWLCQYGSVIVPKPDEHINLCSSNFSQYIDYDLYAYRSHWDSILGFIFDKKVNTITTLRGWL